MDEDDGKFSDEELVDALTVIPETPMLGLHHDLSFEDYAAAPGINVSFLKEFSRCPAKARYGVRKETPALIKGTLIHCAILESDQLERRFMPTKLDRRGTKEWERAEIAAAGKELVKQADYDMALYVRDAVLHHPTARALLQGLNSTEQSFFWNDPVTGLLCKGRTDALRMADRIALDVKSTISAHPDDFLRTVYKYKYHWQNAHYSNGLLHGGGMQIDAFVFIAVEKEKPFVTACYEIEHEDIVRAGELVARNIEAVGECMRTDVWKAYGDKIETLAIRDWDRRQEMEMLSV